MKKLILALLILTSSTAFADVSRGHYDGRHFTHGHWKHSHNGRWEWVVPVVIGGVIVYQATRPPQPIVIQQDTVIIEPNCSPWTEIQNPDGSITRTRTCKQ